MKYTWELPKICMRYAWDMHEICMRFAWDLPEICMRFAWDLPEICPRFGWDLPDMCVRFLLDWVYLVWVRNCRFNGEKTLDVWYHWVPLGKIFSMPPRSRQSNAFLT